MKNSIKNFMREEDGVTALEYGLLAALIAGVLVAAGAGTLRDVFTTLFTSLKTAVEAAFA